MSLVILFIFFLILFAFELLYFKIANKYNIVDLPNHRSSHINVTIRGGGVIFPIAFLLGSFYLGFEYIYFLTGLLLISFISLADDIQSISRKARISSHLITVSLLFYQLSVYNLPVYWILLGFIFAIGTINAINFMDGINGLTGGYGLLTLLTLYYINKYVIAYTNEDYIIICIIGVLIFNFFNFRTNAKCFAGDVGSVSIAFILLFFILELIIKTNNLNYILLLLVYGLDTVTTILFRIIRKEKVLESHRNHFYQFLVNERKIPHLVVAALYILIQGIINILLIKYRIYSIHSLILILVFTTLLFILLRVIMEGPRRLFALSK